MHTNVAKFPLAGTILFGKFERRSEAYRPDLQAPTIPGCFNENWFSFPESICKVSALREVN
jgi:hypothetical protein